MSANPALGVHGPHLPSEGRVRGCEPHARLPRVEPIERRAPDRPLHGITGSARTGSGRLSISPAAASSRSMRAGTAIAIGPLTKPTVAISTLPISPSPWMRARGGPLPTGRVLNGWRSSHDRRRRHAGARRRGGRHRCLPSRRDDAGLATNSRLGFALSRRRRARSTRQSPVTSSNSWPRVATPAWTCGRSGRRSPARCSSCEGSRAMSSPRRLPPRCLHGCRTRGSKPLAALPTRFPLPSHGRSRKRVPRRVRRHIRRASSGRRGRRNLPATLRQLYPAVTDATIRPT